MVEGLNCSGHSQSVGGDSSPWWIGVHYVAIPRGWILARIRSLDEKNATAIGEKYPKLVTSEECSWCENVWTKLYTGKPIEDIGDTCMATKEFAVLKPEDFKADWERETYGGAIDAMHDLLNLANGMGSSKFVVEGMLTALIGEHRTLQQAGIRNFIEMLKAWTDLDEDRMVDGRNKAAWDFAKNLKIMAPTLPII